MTWKPAETSLDPEHQFVMYWKVGVCQGQNSPIIIKLCHTKLETSTRRISYLNDHWEELTVNKAQWLRLAVLTPFLRHLEWNLQGAPERTYVPAVNTPLVIIYEIKL